MCKCDGGGTILRNKTMQSWRSAFSEQCTDNYFLMVPWLHTSYVTIVCGTTVFAGQRYLTTVRLVGLILGTSRCVIERPG